MADKIKTSFGDAQFNSYVSANTMPFIGHYSSRVIDDSEWKSPIPDLKIQTMDMPKILNKMEEKMAKKARGMYQVILVDPIGEIRRTKTNEDGSIEVIGD